MNAHLHPLGFHSNSINNLLLLALIVCCLPGSQASAEFIVRDVHSTGTVSSMAAADALLAGTGIASEKTDTRNFIDMFDADHNTGEGTGHFANNQPFPNNTPGADDNNFAIDARATLLIPAAGTYTFGVNTDDGSRLLMTIGSVAVTIINNTTVHPPQDSFGTVSFASAGAYPIDFTYFENLGQATVELFAAPGNYSGFSQTNTWRLVGDTANGGLSAVPEPSTLVLALLACGAPWWLRSQPRRAAVRVFSVIKRRLVAPVFLVVFALWLAQARAVTIDYLPVDDPGNAPSTYGYGDVAYKYSIAKYDVTNAQYVDFLNAKGVSEPTLYNSVMGGVSFNSGAPVGSQYSTTTGEANWPVVGVTIVDAMRFANWLNNGQGNADINSGSYTIYPATYIGDQEFYLAYETRNPGAMIALPTLDEWYKAAYYNPATDSYFAYPNSSDTAPTASAPSALVNTSNFNNVVGHPTDVGAYPNSVSPYGALDMGGNVAEWDDNYYVGGDHGIHGGSYSDTNVLDMRFSTFSTADALVAYNDVGFRVVLIPEPSTVTLAILGCALLAWPKMRRKWCTRTAQSRN